MTKHRAVVTGYDPTFENPDGSTGRPKGVQTAADMRVATSFDVLEEGIFALHGTPTVVTSPVNTIQITPFMAAIESPNGGYYVIKITENETVELNLTNTGNVKVYVQQQDWELDNDVAAADSAVVFGVAYGATAIPEGALLLFTSTLSGQTSTSGMTFTPAFKWTGAASGFVRVPTVAQLANVALIQKGIRALVTNDGTSSNNGEYFYTGSVWEQTSIANPKLSAFLADYVNASGDLNASILTAQNIDFSTFPRFSAYRNATLSLSSGGGNITFDSEDYDVGNNYSTSTGRFTAPVSGYYDFYAQATISGSYSSYAWLNLFKNGSAVARGIRISASNSNGSSTAVRRRVYLAAGDYVQITISAGAAISVENGAVGGAMTYFEGSLVGL